MAVGYIHSGTMAGKLKGVMPTQTPSGMLMVSQSTPRAMFRSESPKSSVGMPQAYSMFSMPRKIEPRASAWVLPCSRETVWQSLSKFASTSWRYLKKTRARSTGGVSRQAGKAAAAASTAALTSAGPPAGHSAMTSPVDGLKTGVLGIFGCDHSPPTKLGQGVRFMKRGKLQAPTAKLQRNSRDKLPIYAMRSWGSFAVDAAKNQVQL